MLKSGKFKDKLFRSFIIVGIIPLIITTIFSYYNTSRIINDKVNRTIKDNIKVMARLIDSSMGTFISMTNFIANNAEIQGILMKNSYKSYDEKFSDIQEIYKITNSILAAQKLDIPIYITGQKKFLRFTNMISFAPIYEDINSDIFKNADHSVREEHLYINIHRRVDGKERKDIVAGIVKQIRDIKHDKALGYVSLDIYDEYFDDIFKNAKVYKGNNIYILDNSGTIITDKLYKNKTGFAFYEEYLKYVMDNKSGAFSCIIDGRKSIAYFDTLESTGFKIVETIPENAIDNDKKNIITFFLLMLFLFGITAVWVSYLLSKNISKPVNRLTELMNSVEKGDRDVTFDIKCDDEIGRLGVSFNKMVKEINRLIDEVYLKQYLLKDAEFKTLKAQVNPHFLYNTLESINWMAKMGDCSGVSTMITTLGKFLRYSISTKGDIVTVKEDMEQINNYLKLQKMRYGDKFKTEINIEEDIYEKKILKFLIQPLVENAIVHGLEPKRGKGMLIIRGFKDSSNLCFEVIDDGIGMKKGQSVGEGVGMENVNKRIKIHYGDEYGLCYEQKGELTCVRIVIPDV